MQAMAAKTMLAEINSLAVRLFIAAPCQPPLRAHAIGIVAAIRNQVGRAR
jgi:hypothetical protein